MANETFLDVLRKQRQGQAATDLLTPGFSATIAAQPQTVGAQVDGLRGDDQFQALLGGLDKAPSSIPKISPQTREVYEKYNKFLKFYGASTGNYSGAKAFQSGVTSSIDADMIQDLLEDQREQRLSTGLHEILPFVKTESQLREAIKGLGMTMKEAGQAQELWKDYRKDYKYDLDKMSALKQFSEFGADAYTRDIFANMPQGLNQVDRQAYYASKLNELPEGADRDKATQQLTAALEFSGGKDYTPEDFWMPHKVDLKGIGEEGRKRVRAAIDHLKLQGGYWEGDTVRFNPTRVQNVNIKDNTNLRAMETLKRYGVVPVNVDMTGSQMFRLTQDGRPTGGVIHSTNPYGMAYAEEYKNSDSSGRLGYEQQRPDWEDRYWAIGKAERDRVTLQVQHMNMVEALANKGKTVAHMAGGPGAAKFSLYHLGQLAEEWGELFGEDNPLRSVAGNIEYIDTGRKDKDGNSIMEVAPESIEGLAAALEQQAELEVRKVETAGFAEGTSDEDKRLTKKMTKDWRTQLNLFVSRARNVDKMRKDKEYSARILLGFVEAALRAQVARMYIDKDRMLASFYNEMKGRINLTGWLQTEAGAESVLQNVANEAKDRAESKRHLITRYEDPDYELTPGGMPAGGPVTQDLPGLSTQGITEQQRRLNQIRAEAGLPPR